MKTSYKIALIVAVVVAIQGSVFAFSRGVSISEQTRITPQPAEGLRQRCCTTQERMIAPAKPAVTEQPATTPVNQQLKQQQ